MKPARAPSGTTWVSPGGTGHPGQGHGRKLLLCCSVKQTQRPIQEAKVRQREMSGGVYMMQIMRLTETDTDKLPRWELAASG